MTWSSRPQGFPVQCDVAIVGAGFAGLSTAWWLALQTSYKVMLLDRNDRVASEASGRGAGIGRQICDDDTTTEIVVAGAAMLRDRANPLSAYWTPSGGTLWFDSHAQHQEYRKRAQRFSIAVDSNVGPSGERGLYVATDGLIDIAGLAAHYATQAQSAGTTLVLGCNVRQVSVGTAGIELSTSCGAIAASVVVDACGAWAGRLVSRQTFVATRRHLFDVRLPDIQAAEYHWHLGSKQRYYRQQGRHRLYCPCDEVEVDPDQPVAVDPDVQRAARVLFPELQHAPHQARACLRTFSADRRMVLGADPQVPRLMWAAGLGGHGVTASPEIGKRVAQAVVTALDAASASS